MSKEVRAVLEAVALGDDPRITPGDRLKAIEQLARLAPDSDPPAGFASDLAALEDEELDLQLDARLAEQIAADIFGEAKRWPTLAYLVRQEVERRARDLAELLHLDQVEAEIEERVGERLSQTTTPAPVADEIPEPTVAPNPTPPGVLAGFSSGGSRPRSESVFRKRSRFA